MQATDDEGRGQSAVVPLKVYTREFLDNGPDASSVLLGPTINLQAQKIQLSLGWHPQVSGRPTSSGSLNLSDFPRSEVRLLLGVDL